MRLQFRYILPRWLTEQVDEDCVEVLVEPLQATQLTSKMVRSFWVMMRGYGTVSKHMSATQADLNVLRKRRVSNFAPEHQVDVSQSTSIPTDTT